MACPVSDGCVSQGAPRQHHSQTPSVLDIKGFFKGLFVLSFESRQRQDSPQQEKYNSY